MNRINPTIAAIVAGVLALLLVIFVFAGGSSRKDNPDKLSDEQISGARQPGPETRCASQKTYDLIKSELFRQAADVRGDDAGTFSNVASYAFLRMASPRLTGHDQESGVIGCTGSLTLDLPPGLTVAGGRRSLAGDVGYAIRPSADAGDTVTLSNADMIITPLATLSRAGGSANQQVASADPDQRGQVTTAPVNEPRPQPEPRQVDSRPPPPAPAPPPARAAPRPVRVPSAATRPSPVAPAPRATASPSFNCRSARTRGEIAVCRDSGLASLDRQMAAQFNNAVSAADAGRRAQLQRSRGRFLRFRDSCSSEACMAGAYRDRMREIDDIMNERWRPR